MFVPTRASLHGILAILVCLTGGCGWGAMSSAPPPQLSVREWVGRLRSDDPRVRAEAGAALSTQASAAVEPLLELLGDGLAPVESRLYALDCLGKVTGVDPRVRAGVVRSVRDANSDVRQQAVRALVNGHPDSKLSVTDLRALTIEAQPDVLHEFGDWLAADKVQSEATPAELVTLIDEFCQRGTWLKECPSVALGMLALLNRESTPLSPDQFHPFTATFFRMVKHLPESRGPLLNARLSEVASGTWLTGSSPSVSAGANRSPATDERQAEVQTVEFACELAQRVLQSGHVDERQVRGLYRRPTTDPLRVLAERAAASMERRTVLAFHLDVVVSGDRAGRREALAVLSGQSVEELESFKSQLYQSLPPLANRDDETCRSLLALLLRLGPPPQQAGTVLAQLARHADKRQSEAALALISTMEHPPLVEVPLTDTVFQLIDNAAGPLASRRRALDQIDRQLAPQAAFTGPLLGVLIHVANNEQDPLRERAEELLEQRRATGSGGLLNDLRQSMESSTDLFVQRIDFRPAGQIVVAGWCSRQEVALASHGEIMQKLSSAPALEWARWRRTLNPESKVTSGFLSVEIDVVPVNFQSALQAAVQQEKELQGCTILSAQVSSRGNIVLKVLLNQPDQRARLEAAAQRLAKSTAWANRIPGSVVFLEAATVPTADLLAKIRDACERRKLQVWISGLTLNVDGRLALTGWSAEPPDKVNDVCEWAAELLKDHPLNKYLAGRPQGLSAPRVTPRLEPLQPDWIELLTDAISRSPQAPDVAIDRAYYTAAGKLMIEGVQSAPDAFAVVEPELQIALKQPPRQRFLPQGFEFSPFPTQRWNEMAADLQKVILLHPECDGVRITGVSRGSRQEWIFSGTTTAAMTERRTQALAAALAQVPGGVLGSRTPSFRQLNVIERDLIAADRAVTAAITHLAAKEYDEAHRELETAILHAPDIGLHWHVRGLNFLAQKETLLARQNFYRAALLETKNLKALERLQGPGSVQLRSDAIALQREITNHLRNPAWLEKELQIRRLEKPVPGATKKPRLN